MKILMIGNSSKVKGGITSVIQQTLNFNWSNKDIDMKFISTYRYTNRLLMMLYFIVAYIKVLWSLLFFKPDIVHIHMSYKGSFHRKNIIYKLCKVFNIKTIIHLHGSEFQKWYDSLPLESQEKVKLMLRTCDRFLVLGEKWNGIIKEIEHGTKTSIIKNSVPNPQCLINYNDDYFNILFLGVLIKRKGVSDLIQAINLLKDRIDISKLNILIAGTGEEEESLKLLTQELKLNKIISFEGWIDKDMKDILLRKSQLLVLPSYNEGLPVAILEAMSYGLPIIATDVGDISTAVKSGINGYLIKPGDIVALSEYINELYLNKKLFQKMSFESNKIFREYFSEEKYFETLINCYYSL